MILPENIPAGVRIVVRVSEGVDETTGRPSYRDFVGHVEHWDGARLTLIRDASADGRRAAQRVVIDREDIVRLKPVPERPARSAAGGQ